MTSCGSHYRLVAELVDEALHRWGSPIYIYDLARLRERVETFRKAAPSGTKLTYAVMANDNEAILRLLRAWGVDVFVGSREHLNAVAEAGFPSSRVVAGLTNLGPAGLSEVARRADTLLLDSAEAIEDAQAIGGKRNRFLIRVALQEPPDAPRRLGVRADIVQTMWHRWQALDPRVVGLHSYFGTFVQDFRLLGDLARRLFEFADSLGGVEEVDCGGGFGTDGPLQESLRTYWGRVGKEYSRRYITRLEPGRLLVGPCCWFVTEVERVRSEGPVLLVGVNATIGSFPRRFIFGAPDWQHEIEVVSRESSDQAARLAQVVGNSTYSGDVFYEGSLKPVASGDRLIFRDAGAYCRSASLSFLGVERPFEVRICQREGRLTLTPLAKGRRFASGSCRNL